MVLLWWWAGAGCSGVNGVTAGEGHESLKCGRVGRRRDLVGERPSSASRRDDRVRQRLDLGDDFVGDRELLPAGLREVPAMEQELQGHDAGPDGSGHLPSFPIPDPDDQPILDPPVSAAVDVIVTGDKHFLSLVVDGPQILTARQFLDACGHGLG